MELKTLKDIKEVGSKSHSISGTCYKKDLKKEAVKWVKSEEMVSNDVKLWIEHFFNITEEDLK